MSAAAKRAVRAGLEAHDKQHVDNLNRAIGARDRDSPANFGQGQLLRVFHREGAAIGSENVKRLKWPRGMHLSQLFSRHAKYRIQGNCTSQGIGVGTTDGDTYLSECLMIREIA